MKKEYKIIVDYVEGRLSAESFHNQFLTNKSLQSLLRKKMPTKYSFLSEYNYSLYDLMQKDWWFVRHRWNSYTIRYMLQQILSAFLDENKVKYTLYSKYREEYSFLLKIQPAWLYFDDDSIFQKIMDEIPQDLPKTKRIAMGKEKIKALFKYDKTYPRWVQSPEWPIVNGKPLVFSHQQKAKGGDIRTYYYFYDEDTEKETVIVQFE